MTDMDMTYDDALDFLKAAEAHVQDAIGEVVTEDDMAAISLLRRAFSEVQRAEWLKIQAAKS